MSKKSVTYELVRIAMTELKAAGKDPSSVRLVRGITKTGSNDTIKTLIAQVHEDWNAETEAVEIKQAADLCEQYPLPESIAEFVTTISIGLEKLPLLYAENAACARASNIRDGDIRLTALTAEHRKEISNLVAEYEGKVGLLTDELKGKDAEISNLRGTSSSLHNELTECLARATKAEEKLTFAEERIAQLTAALTENAETQQALQQLLDFAKNLPPQPDTKIAAAD